jgi:hypothetical protein
VSEILGVPMSFLFEDLPGSKSRASAEGLPKYLVDFMQTSQGQRVVEALSRISDRNVRNRLAELIETIAQTAGARSKKKKKST